METELARRLQHMEWTQFIIVSQLLDLAKREDELMVLGQDILDMVTAEDTKVDSVIALLQGLVDAGTIPQSVLDAIKAKVQGSEDKLDKAIAANTPPV